MMFWPIGLDDLLCHSPTQPIALNAKIQKFFQFPLEFQLKRGSKYLKIFKFKWTKGIAGPGIGPFHMGTFCWIVEQWTFCQWNVRRNPGNDNSAQNKMQFASKKTRNTFPRTGASNNRIRLFASYPSLRIPSMRGPPTPQGALLAPHRRVEYSLAKNVGYYSNSLKAHHQTFLNINFFFSFCTGGVVIWLLPAAPNLWLLIPLRCVSFPSSPSPSAGVGGVDPLDPPATPLGVILSPIIRSRAPRFVVEVDWRL